MQEKLLIINLEVTQKCALNCPQCSFAKSSAELDIELAKRTVSAAKSLGLKAVNISGGETILYQHLTELIAHCAAEKIISNIAISGVGFDEMQLNNFLAAGLYGIFVSLNGSNEKINLNSRGGFKEAIAAIELVANSNTPFKAINWVMQSNNAENFPEVVKLAEKNGFHAVYILMYKRTAADELNFFPTAIQLKKICEFIRNYRGKVEIVVDRCFSQLRAMLGDWIFGNTNSGIFKGCRAGLDTCTLNVDGTFSPCRHMKIFEHFDSMRDYWQKSDALKKIRAADSRSPPCNKCRYFNFCRPCLVNANCDDKFSRCDNSYCPLGKNF